MTTIVDALAQIYRIEGALTITSPVSKSVLKVWPYFPPASQVVTSTPAFVNTYTVRNVLFESALKRVDYSVHARLVIFDPNSDRASEIAAAFQEPIILAFASNIKLGMRDWLVQTLRFNGEQPVLFQDLTDESGRVMMGLDFFIDLQHSTVATYAIGAVPV